MTFSDPIFFLVFLPVAVVGFQLLGRFGRRSAIGFLAFVSILFYAKWSIPYTGLLLGSILGNYLISIAIDRSSKRPSLQSFWLIAGIAANLGLLARYKYMATLLTFFSQVTGGHREWFNAILPLGISFFTFTQIAYLVDLKQGIAKREGLLNYTLFVTFFPHLIAGPIIHHKEMMPQFSQERRYQLNRDDMALGITWFTMGMFKKVMIADRISPFADAFFAHPQSAGTFNAWAGVITYSMQLYFDFSGYSDMAVGLARMFSIHFPLNFNSPYKSTNIIDFWNRWHMTLTRYVMDYVYSPIQFAISRRRIDQGKKVSRKASATAEGFTQMIALPTLFTLFLAGVWHGAGLQFLLYGLLHGAYITTNHAWRIFVPAESRLKKLMTVPVSIGITYVCVLVGEVLFRSPGLPAASSVFAGMLGRHGAGTMTEGSQIILLILLLSIVWLMPNTQEILGQTRKDDEPNWSIVKALQWSPTLGWLAATSVAFIISMFYSSSNATFLYFQF